jgi:hypothetical protein
MEWGAWGLPEPGANTPDDLTGGLPGTDEKRWSCLWCRVSLLHFSDTTKTLGCSFFHDSEKKSKYLWVKDPHREQKGNGAGDKKIRRSDHFQRKNPLMLSHRTTTTLRGWRSPSLGSRELGRKQNKRLFKLDSRRSRALDGRLKEDSWGGRNSALHSSPNFTAYALPSRKIHP